MYVLKWAHKTLPLVGESEPSNLFCSEERDWWEKNLNKDSDGTVVYWFELI